ncbi:NAD(P)/FAD-dependent oxidoreductase [Pseudonocardia oroxyli]|uniref:Sarcosine oxidase n=1 Tax=Pseudonocardia oroxyli TaxID=366584 RepID=A0A1G8CEG5_PSEOR|nr:FAD-dependent oxidoreductase [Pseudonocardia oroxyli]SDH43280.1 sarcosine oxidase [Pseudonocardia oroxyli]
MSLVPRPRTPCPRPAESAEIVVVGAGVAGAAAAWQLARRGHDVLVLERFGPGHGRTGVPQYRRVGDGDPALAAEAWSWWRELERETGAGLLTVTGAVDHGDRAVVAALAEAAAVRGGRVEWLEPRAAAVRWPGREFEGPVLHRRDWTGRLAADEAVAALAAAAVGWGARIRYRTTVKAVDVRGADRVDIRTEGGTVRARRVVATVGAASIGLVAGRVVLPPLGLVQERVLHVTGLPSGPVVTRHIAGSVEYTLPLPDGRVEIGREGNVTAPVPTRWFPGVAATPDPHDRTYTTSPDGAVVLAGASPVAVGAGFAGHRFSLAPALGRLLADLVTDVEDRVFS